MKGRKEMLVFTGVIPRDRQILISLCGYTGFKNYEYQSRRDYKVMLALVKEKCNI